MRLPPGQLLLALADDAPRGGEAWYLSCPSPRAPRARLAAH
jgi:hypothetical protein